MRWLLPGLKVYHIPLVSIASSATLPNFFTFLPYLRTILLREHVTLVHAHGGLSSLAHEAVLHAHLLGVRTVFTDHSLFGFADAASILTNKLLEGALRNVDAVICVSHTGCVIVRSSLLTVVFTREGDGCRRENTVLRANLRPETAYVIPNALVPEQFTPAETPVPTDTSMSFLHPPNLLTRTDGPRAAVVTIVVVSRLAYRKGIDLLVAVAPRICAQFPDVRFVVGQFRP